MSEATLDAAGTVTAAKGCAITDAKADGGTRSFDRLDETLPFPIPDGTRSLSGKRFAEAVRGLWSIESMHWVLDVTFCEDDSRTRERTLGNNRSWLRRLAVTQRKRYLAKDSLRSRRPPYSGGTAFLEEVRTFQGD